MEHEGESTVIVRVRVSPEMERRPQSLPRHASQPIQARIPAAVRDQGKQ